LDAELLNFSNKYPKPVCQMIEKIWANWLFFGVFQFFFHLQQAISTKAVLIILGDKFFFYFRKMDAETLALGNAAQFAFEWSLATGAVFEFVKGHF
jgi:hypothetical protein